MSESALAAGEACIRLCSAYFHASTRHMLRSCSACLEAVIIRRLYRTCLEAVIIRRFFRRCLLQLEVSQTSFCMGTSRSGGTQVEGSIEELEGKLEGAREHGRELVRPCSLRLSLLWERLLLKRCIPWDVGVPCRCRLHTALRDKCPMHGSHNAFLGTHKVYYVLFLKCADQFAWACAHWMNLNCSSFGACRKRPWRPAGKRVRLR